MQKGTIIEKLNEEVVDNSQHLKHLIGICEGNSNTMAAYQRNLKILSCNFHRLTLIICSSKTGR